jgi:hypothetical protein
LNPWQPELFDQTKSARIAINEPCLQGSRLGKRPGRNQRIELKAVEILVIGELHQHHCGDRRLNLPDRSDRLRNTVFQNAKVFLFQSWNEGSIL